MGEPKINWIDVPTWDRATHYEIFRSIPQPQYCVTFELDITQFLPRIRKKGYSFTFSMVYAVTRCASQVEAFRCRFVDGKPAVFDTINTSFTYLNPDTELFKVVNVDMQDTLREYVALASRTVLDQKEYFTGPMGNDIFQFSPFPWVSYTHISHTDSGNRDNAVPLFDWGKFYEKDGRIKLPFSVQVHHSFVDGVHIGKMADLLQTYLNDFNAG